MFARLADGKLGKEIEQNLPLLFIDRAARVAGNEDRDYAAPRAFDHAIATVCTPGLDLRFVRMRGELAIEIAVPGEPRTWQALDSALAWSDAQRGIHSQPVPNWGPSLDGSGFDWPAIDRFFVDNWERMHAAAREPSIASRRPPA
jgi:hypothetical protein